MDEIFVESTLWIGLLVSLLVTIGLWVASYYMASKWRWRAFAIVFFLLFFVLPVVDAVWKIF